MANTIWDTLTGCYHWQEPKRGDRHTGTEICNAATAHYNALSDEQKRQRAGHSRKPNAKEVTPAFAFAAAAKSTATNN